MGVPIGSIYNTSYHTSLDGPGLGGSTSRIQGNTDPLQTGCRVLRSRAARACLNRCLVLPSSSWFCDPSPEIYRRAYPWWTCQNRNPTVVPINPSVLVHFELGMLFWFNPNRSFLGETSDVMFFGGKFLKLNTAWRWDINIIGEKHADRRSYFVM